MNLQLLLCGIDYVVLQEMHSIDKNEIKSIVCDSKKINKQDMFVCIDGAVNDGHDYIEEAYERGAEVLIVEKLGKHGQLSDFPEDMTVILVREAKGADAQIVANFFWPSCRTFQNYRNYRYKREDYSNDDGQAYAGSRENESRSHWYAGNL